MIKASNLFVHGSNKLFQILNNIPSQVLTSKKDQNETQNAATVEKIKKLKVNIPNFKKEYHSSPISHI